MTSHLGLLATAAATLGHVTGSSGTVTVGCTGSKLTVGGLYIGYIGHRALDIASGGQVTTD